MDVTTTTKAWGAAVDTGSFELWVEHLDRVEIADHFGFLSEQQALLVNGTLLPIHDWLSRLGNLSQSDWYAMMNDAKREVRERLAIATFIRWRDRARALLDNYEP